MLKPNIRFTSKSTKSMLKDSALMLFDNMTGQTRYVMDTKYKAPTTPRTDDVAQIIAYAATQGCSEAILIYPQPLEKPLHTKVQEIRIRTLTLPSMETCSRQERSF
jgi:5-methylcytosine-specific restriction enzyme subunit McrC